MKTDMIEQAAEYAVKRQRRRRRRKLLTCLGAAVVFCTTYALILPAITMESGYICGKTEHQHDATCFTTVEYKQLSAALTCQPEAHVHTDACFDEQGRVICGLSDQLLHRHDAECYYNNELICTLPEVTEHIHSEACFQQTWELTCTSEEEGHEHGEECYAVTSTLICPLEQIAVHDHTAECYGEDGTLTCGILSAGEHQHSEECLTVTDDGVLTEQLLICDIQEHTHDETCLPDGEPAPDEEPAAEPLPLEEPTDSDPEPSVEEPEQPEVSDPEPSAEEPEQPEVSDPEPSTEDPEQPEDSDPEPSAEDPEQPEISDPEPSAEDPEQPETSDPEPSDTPAVEDTFPDIDDPSHPPAEYAVGTNWMTLRDSGWFEEYSDYSLYDAYGISTFSDDGLAPAALYEGVTELTDEESAKAKDDSPSGAEQIEYYGGSVGSSHGVGISKTIQGTELENVFDITLQVQTPQKNVEIVHDPDMAVVIVMDISATMNSNFGTTTRYKAAMEAAEDFLDKFADSNTAGISKIGYVAFNTDAHKIFELQDCSDQTTANALKNIMRNGTGDIITPSSYSSSHNRFTNIEAGLKMAQDMLNGVSNKNKFIVFLSDGFPTTYIESGYNGYDPYDTTGTYFYDAVLDKKCLYGTSYSDEAAIRARNVASSIKTSGITVFSIGVDVAGQTVQEYITASEKANGFSLVDRTGTTYEIGDASSTEAYKAWLKDSIGSSYYYDSTDAAGLMEAYQDIFKTIKETVMLGSKPDWVATDPIPSLDSTHNIKELEFIGLYDQTGALRGNALSGTYASGAENSAKFLEDSYTISWDLKNSGYHLDVTTDEEGAQINVLTYTLRYRVRLKNEADGFSSGQPYETNGTTTLQYRVVEKRNNDVYITDAQTIEFPIPKVHGYLGELTFTKVDSYGTPLPGAEFTLSHDDVQCSRCRGNAAQDGATETRVKIPDKTAVSDADGKVTFTDIPSGHTYTLTETQVPAGYVSSGHHYTVIITYNKAAVVVKDYRYQQLQDAWDYDNPTIVNNVYYELPETGGAGTHWMYAAGLLLMAAALLLIVPKRRGRNHSPPD